MAETKTLFGLDKPVIGMLHVAPSPGVPGFPGIQAAVEKMRLDLQAYLRAGVDALLLENMHDFPCVAEREMGPEIAAYLTRLAMEARRLCDEALGGAARPLPLGVQVLFAASRTAVAVAQAAGLQFVRAEAWTHAHISDKGIVEAQGGKVKRYQHHIGADGILVLTDIKKKHASHAWTADLGLADVAELLEMHRSDGAIVTGTVTGRPPRAEDLTAVRAATRLPVIVGSGVTEENLAEHFPLADAFIVGSHFKREGHWEARVEPERVRAFMDAARRLRREA